MLNKFRNSLCICGSSHKFKYCHWLEFVRKAWNQMATPEEVSAIKKEGKYYEKKYRNLTKDK